MFRHALCLSVVAIVLCASVSVDSARSFRGGQHMGKNSSSTTFAAGTQSFSAAFASDMAALKLGVRTAEQQCNIIGLYGAAPTMCLQGQDRWSKEELKAHIPKFLEFLKKQKTILPNHCCMGVNHMFALHYLVSSLKPAAIIESGVAAGHQTFMLREAAPQSKIFSIDPGDPASNYGYGAFGAWKDVSGMTTYLTGPWFKDLSLLDWGQLIPDPAVRAKTLVILDDHQSCVERFKILQLWGFRWAFYEDNYPFKVATSNDPYTCPDLGQTVKRDFDSQAYALGDAYSPNAACGSPYPIGLTEQFWYKDAFGLKCKLANITDHGNLLRYLQSEMEVYFEFPPLFTPCKTARPALLGNDTTILAGYGLPPVKMEIWQYGHLFPSFVTLRPLSDTKRQHALSSFCQSAANPTTAIQPPLSICMSGVGMHQINTSVPKKLSARTINASLRRQ